jgi:hypothetical protein
LSKLHVFGRLCAHKVDMRRTSSSVSTTFSEELAQLASVAALAIPALGIVIVDPLMSLVDTACIGRTMSTHLAALAPNSSVFNIIFQVRAKTTMVQYFAGPTAVSDKTYFKCRYSFL